MITLSVEPRTQLRKKVQKLRAEGYVPAILYGPKVATTPLQVSYKDFQRAFKEAGESSLVRLDFQKTQPSPEVTAGKDEKAAVPVVQTAILIRSVAVHPVTRAFLHADFYQVPLDEKIEIKIPVEYEGEAPAVKAEGATLVRNLFEIEVRALPTDLPHEIRVDLTPLEHIGNAITVADLILPSGVEIVNEPDTVVAAIEAAQAEETIEEAPAEGNLEAIKTEGEEKREEKAEAEEAETQE